MRAVDVIRRKRDGEELTKEEIEFLVLGFTRGEIPDYQMSSWLMAVMWRGMSAQETVDLTLAMAHSGDVLDLSDVAPLVLDKHSSGGVGQKASMVIAPWVASLGLPVAMMSGRGLGFVVGTLDKLESVPGFNVTLSEEQFKDTLRRHGIVVAAQTTDMAPADGKIYALRDVTGTVESLPLIASSIMSKKIASGTDAIALTVKMGSGAYMKSEENAQALAETMVNIGRGAGRRMSALLTDVEQPLGRAVGNALDMRESIDVLQGGGPQDILEHSTAIATEMLLLAGACDTPEAGRKVLMEALESGQALTKFREWMRAQGGDERVVDDPTLMPQARLLEDLPSPHSGYVSAVKAEDVGWASVVLGAGRQKKGDEIDRAVGVVLHKKVGDPVEEGEPLLTIHANDEARLAEVKDMLLGAYAWSETPVTPPPLIRRIIR
jgi:pyrimidine-nucleoside phosphorylase